MDFMNEIFSDFNGQRNEEKTLGIVLSETLNTSIEKEIEGIKRPQNQISKFGSKLCQKNSSQTHESHSPNPIDSTTLVEWKSSFV